MTRVIVYHRGYGCDTGCCGHAVDVFPDDAVTQPDFDPYWSGGERDKFVFDHPYDDYDDAARLRWAQELVRRTYGEEHVKDLDWEHCIVSAD